MTLLIGSQATQRGGDQRLDPDRAGRPAATPTATSIAFGIELPAGAAVDVFGLQVEAQAAASRI